MQVDPIGTARAVAQHGAVASPRGISDAAAARAAEESRFEKLRRERSAASGSPVRALLETDEAESKVSRSEDGAQPAEVSVHERRTTDYWPDEDGEHGRLVDYSA